MSELAQHLQVNLRILLLKNINSMVKCIFTLLFAAVIIKAGAQPPTFTTD